MDMSYILNEQITAYKNKW